MLLQKMLLQNPNLNYRLANNSPTGTKPRQQYISHTITSQTEMHETRPAKITSPIVDLGGAHVKLMPLALIVGAIGVGLTYVLYGFSLQRFSYIYLVNFAFVLTMCIGCLFFVTISHLTRAGWNVTVRRIAELYAQCLPVLFVLFLPILIPLLFSDNGLYVWNQAGWSIHNADASVIEAVNEPGAQIPPLEALKRTYLNKGFFALRWVVYFCIWGGMATFFLRTSLKQDETGNKNLTSRMQAFSAPAMIVFAVSIVFSSMDLLMSLEPLWFSTMFPVYFFAGSVLSALALITLTCLYLQKTGRITDEVTVEHYHDMGKLMFGFIVFWGYIAFSQFMLIWYANIPEETFWYDLRINQPGWKGLSLILLVGHLFIPFFLLMGRGLRRNKILLTISAVFILCMHWVDHYWLVMPHLNPGENEFTLSGMGFLTGISCLVGMIAVYIALFCIVTGNRPFVPLQEPRLGEALNHEVH